MKKNKNWIDENFNLFLREFPIKRDVSARELSTLFIHLFNDIKNDDDWFFFSVSEEEKEVIVKGTVDEGKKYLEVFFVLHMFNKDFYYNKLNKRNIKYFAISFQEELTKFVQEFIDHQNYTVFVNVECTGKRECNTLNYFKIQG